MSTKKTKALLSLPAAYVLTIAFLFGTKPGSAVWSLIEAQYTSARNRAKKMLAPFWIIKAVEIFAAIGYFFIQHNVLMGVVFLLLIGIEPLIFLQILRGLSSAKKNQALVEDIASILYPAFYVVVFFVSVFFTRPWSYADWFAIWFSFLLMGSAFGLVIGKISKTWFKFIQIAMITIAVIHLSLPIVWPSGASRFGYHQANEEIKEAQNEVLNTLLGYQKENLSTEVAIQFIHPPIARDANGVIIGSLDVDRAYGLRAQDTTRFVNQIHVAVVPYDSIGQPVHGGAKLYVLPDAKNIKPFNGTKIQRQEEVVDSFVLLTTLNPDSILWKAPHPYVSYYVEVPAGCYARLTADDGFNKIFNNSNKPQSNKFGFIPGDRTWKYLQSNQKIKIFKIVL